MLETSISGLRATFNLVSVYAVNTSDFSLFFHSLLPGGTPLRHDTPSTSSEKSSVETVDAAPCVSQGLILEQIFLHGVLVLFFS